MITRLRVENFKALADFDLPPKGHRLGHFTCLIGLNGSGKSTLLQALDFAAHIVSGTVADWLEQRNWRASEVATTLGKWKPVVNYEVGFQDAEGVDMTWQGRFNLTHLRCTSERVVRSGKTLLELDAERLVLATPEGELKPRGEKLNLVGFDRDVM